MIMSGVPVSTATTYKNVVFWSQILIAYSLLLFLLVSEVQSKCRNYKVYFGRSKYVFEQCCMKARLMGIKENNSQGG